MKIGNGIPKKILDKIFQPFFTTKPTGHGTGLGLNLSYDNIIAHGGELKVETQSADEAGMEGEVRFLSCCLLADERCIVPTALRFEVVFGFSGLKSGVIK